MTQASDRWRRLSALFDQAAPLPADARARFVTALSGGDEPLRDELASMLAADAGVGVLDANVQDLADKLTVPATIDGLIGRQIGNWRIVDIVGRGGMGAVYRAERADGAYAQRAALKLIQLGVDSPEMRARFLRERQFLASLQHPNIATLLDGGVSADGTPYLAMEFVDGERIDAYCDAKKLTVAQRLKLVQQVLAAVQHAHQRLIVHRDLKPSNILVGPDGAAKLLDFGIGAVLDASGAAASTRDRPYTPGYAAPEQLQGEPVTTATDVYALGVILLRLLGGLSENSFAASDRVRHSDADSSGTLPALASGADADALADARSTTPRALRRMLRGDLDTIVLRATSHEPARRYPSAQALSADIELWLARRPILARPDSWSYRARKFVRRNRIAVALSSLAIAALLSATLFSAQQAHRASLAAQDAETRALSLRAVSDAFDHMFRVEHVLPDAEGPASAARLLRENLSALDYFLADQPLTRAGLLLRTGRALRLAGDDAAALPALQGATAAFARAGAAASPQGRDATLELARALADAGETAAAGASLDALERALRPDEINLDLRRHAIAYLRARLLLAAGNPAAAATQIASALALALAPNGERGARFGRTALLAGTIALVDAPARAAEHFSAAFDAMADDPHAELAPAHQPLGPAFETLARLGRRAEAGDLAARWHALRETHYGRDSAQAREAALVEQRLAAVSPENADEVRGTRLLEAINRYWQASFVNYDVTRDPKAAKPDGG